MEIIVYDSQLNRKGVVDECTIIWTRKYYEPGNFEIHVALTDRNVDLLQIEYIIAKHDSIEAGVIESILKDERNMKLIVKGRFLSSYLDRRVIRKTYSFNGASEVAMRNLIGECEAIPLVELGELKRFSEPVIFQATYKELLSIETKIAKTSGLGYRLIPNFTTKKLVFEVYKGIDRTQSQSFNQRVVFSNDYGNLNNVQHNINTQKSKTFAVIGGEGEGAYRTYVEVGEGVGLERREIFVDAKDIKSEDFSNRNDYLEALKQKGIEKLSAMAIKESFEYETSPNANFIYKKDYDLGDIVTIRKDSWNLNENKRITEIQEIYENGGLTVVPTLGDALGTAVEWSNY